MENVTQVSDRHHAVVDAHARRADWFPRIVQAELSAPHATRPGTHSPRLVRAIPLPLPAATPPSSPKPPAPRHDLIALRKACEAQAFSAYAHTLGREEYERGEYQRAVQWQRQAADATRGAIMYRELARMLFSAGGD